jgi:hypothetical protein
MAKKNTTENRRWTTEDRGQTTEDGRQMTDDARREAGDSNDGQIGIQAVVKTVNTNHKGTVICLAGCVFATPEERWLVEDLVREKGEVIVTIRPREPKML